MTSLIKFSIDGQDKLSTRVQLMTNLSEIRKLHPQIINQDHRFIYQENQLPLSEEDTKTVKDIAVGKLIKLTTIQNQDIQFNQSDLNELVKVMIVPQQKIVEVKISKTQLLSEFRETFQYLDQEYQFLFSNTPLNTEDESLTTIEELLEDEILYIKLLNSKIESYDKFFQEGLLTIAAPFEALVNKALEDLISIDKNLSLDLYQQYKHKYSWLKDPNLIINQDQYSQKILDFLSENVKITYKEYKQLRSEIIKSDEVVQEFVNFNRSDALLKILKNNIFELLNKGETWDILIEQLQTKLNMPEHNKNFLQIHNLLQDNPIKFLFFLVYLNSDASLRDRLIASLTKYYAAPLIYPVFDSQQLKFNVVEEHFWTISNSHLIINLGIGKARSKPIGKSQLISDLFKAHLLTHGNEANPLFRSTIDIYSNRDGFPGSYDCQKYKFDKTVRYTLLDINGQVPELLALQIIEQLTQSNKAIFLLHANSEQSENELYSQLNKDLLKIINERSFHNFVFFRDYMQSQNKTTISLLDENRTISFYVSKNQSGNTLKEQVFPIIQQTFKKQYQLAKSLPSIQSRVNCLTMNQSLLAKFIQQIGTNSEYQTLQLQKLELIEAISIKEFQGFKFLDFYPIYMKMRKLEQIYQQLTYNESTKVKKDKMNAINQKIKFFERQLKELGKSYQDEKKSNKIINTFISIIQSNFDKNLIVSDLQKWLASFSVEMKETDKEEQKNSDINSDIKEIQENDKFSVEIIFRELYIQQKYFSHKNHQIIMDIIIELFNLGEPVEIVDGDNLVCSLDYLSNLVFKQVQSSKPLYITIFGAQSSGKSTCLNHVFGCQFFASDGRATRGLYMSFLQFNKETQSKVRGYDSLAIIDTEGFDSIEREYLGSIEYYNQVMKQFDIRLNDNKIVEIQNTDIPEVFKFDNIVSLFTLSISDIILINTKGESVGEKMRRLLFLCIRGLVELKSQKASKPDVFFIMNQCSQTSLDKIEGQLNMSLKEIMDMEELKKVIVNDDVEISSLITLKKENISILPSAFFTRDRIGEEYFSMPIALTQIDKSYSGECQRLRAKLFNLAFQRKEEGSSLLKQLYQWALMSSNNFESINTFQKLWSYSDKTSIIVERLLIKLQDTLLVEFDQKFKQIRNIQTQFCEIAKDSQDLSETFSKYQQDIINKCQQLDLQLQQNFEQEVEKNAELKPYAELPITQQYKTNLLYEVIQLQNKEVDLLKDLKNQFEAQIQTMSLGGKIKQKLISKLETMDISQITVEYLREEFEKEYLETSQQFLNHITKPDAVQCYNTLNRDLHQLTKLRIYFNENDVISLEHQIQENQNKNIYKQQLKNHFQTKEGNLYCPVDDLITQRLDEIMYSLRAQSQGTFVVKTDLKKFNFEYNIINAIPSGDNLQKDFTYLKIKDLYYLENNLILKNSWIPLITTFENQNPDVKKYLQKLVKNDNTSRDIDVIQVVCKLLNHYGKWDNLNINLKNLRYKLQAQHYSKELFEEYLGRVQQIINDVNKELKQLNAQLDMNLQYTIISFLLLIFTQRKFQQEIEKYSQTMKGFQEQKESIWQELYEWFIAKTIPIPEFLEIDDAKAATQFSTKILQFIKQKRSANTLPSFISSYNQLTSTINHETCNQIIKFTLTNILTKENQDTLFNFFTKSYEQIRILEDMLKEKIQSQVQNLTNEKKQQLSANIKLDLNEIIQDLEYIYNTLTGEENEYFCNMIFKNTKSIQFCGWYYLKNFIEKQQATKYEFEEQSKLILPEQNARNFSQNLRSLFDEAYDVVIKNLKKFLKLVIDDLKFKESNLNSIQDISEKLNDQEKNFIQEILIRGIGCREKCPNCKRKCSLSASHTGQKHICQQGHYVQGFVGIGITNKPEELCMVSCETHDQYNLMPWLSSTQSHVEWSEYKAAHSDWDFSTGTINAEENQRIQKQVWNIIGQRLCDHYNKNFSKCSFDNYRR